MKLVEPVLRVTKGMVLAPPPRWMDGMSAGRNTIGFCTGEPVSFFGTSVLQGGRSETEQAGGVIHKEFASDFHLRRP